MGPTLHVEDLVPEEAVNAIKNDSSLAAETVDLTNASQESEAVSLVETDIGVCTQVFRSAGTCQLALTEIQPINFIRCLEIKVCTCTNTRI